MKRLARSGLSSFTSPPTTSFDGTKSAPYIESDQTNPLGVYGASKLAGEQALAATGAPHIILRTSWVYGATGKNFLLTILKLARERPELKIVADQHGAPTWSRDLAILAAYIVHHCESESASLGLPLSSVVEQCRRYLPCRQPGRGPPGTAFASEGVRLQQLAEPNVKFANLDSHRLLRVPHPRQASHELPPQLR